MGSLEVRSHRQHLFQSGDGFRVREVFRRAPQELRARQMPFRQAGVEY
jgi:hypothetical protein